MTYLLALATAVAIFAILAVAYELVFGHAGRFSAAPIAFYATGAYVGALVLTRITDQFVVAVAAGAFAAYALGWLVARISLHLEGDYFIVATLGLQFLVLSIITNWESVTGGLIGLSAIPRPTFAGIVLTSVEGTLAAVLVVLGATVVASWRIVHSPLGRLLHAIRDDEGAAIAMGHDAPRIVRSVFALSAAMSGAAGVLYAGYLTFIDPTSFRLEPLILVTAMVIIGGNGSVVGPLLGSLVLLALPEVLKLVGIAGPTNSAFLQNALFGVILVAMVVMRPAGIIPEGSIEAFVCRFGKVRSAFDGGDPQSAPRVRTTSHGRYLRADHVIKRFGGIIAVADVSLTLRPGTITSVIGPNGAGKSTFLACISGGIRADAGHIFLDDHDVTTLTSDAIVRRGAARTFQDPRVFGRLSVVDNILVAVPHRSGMGVIDALFRRRTVAGEARQLATTARELVQWLGLGGHAFRPASELSYGQQKLLALGRLLGTEAHVLLLDEPTAGVAPGLITDIVERLKQLRTAGHAICLVEHNMDVVAELSDVVVVMESGRIAIAGPPAEVFADKRVHELYLGV